MLRIQLPALFFFCIATLSSFAQDIITLPAIQQSARLIGLQLTPAETDSMRETLQDNRKEYAKMRTAPLPNNIPLLSWPTPQPASAGKQQPVQWNIPGNVQMPVNKNDLAFYSILQLASLIKNKKISSAELTKFFISRIRRFDDSLRCTVSITEDIALQQAAAADAEIAKGKYRGPLHGIPYGLKDLFAVKGTKTTWGAAPYKEQVIDEDAFVYLQLQKAGAVLVAKFTLGALAMGDNWYGGRTRNPWNTERGSSGSSAGSAAATVAGLVPFAIGTETWGSIVSPSHVCGATGLRPTFGAISRTGAMTLSWSLDKAGPICRSAEDAAIVFNYLHGTDGKDFNAVNMSFNYTGKTNLKKLRIAYAKNYFDQLDASNPAHNALTHFRSMGVQLVPVEFPDSSVYQFDMIGLIIGAESAAAFDELTRSNTDDLLTRQTKNDWPNFFRASRFIPAVEYINAMRLRYLLAKKVDAVISQYDAIICPSFAGNQVAITNLSGHPAIVMPAGLNKNNLPGSITLVGRLFDEAGLLAIAKAWQEATPYDEMHPPSFR
jgi:Asp-tRNA(Asn)/Glu-tRNA(Gln) amidotransferase A subunit family amidase